MTRRFTTIGVVGLGTMGAGIVEVLARHGLTVLTVERDEASVDSGRAMIERSTARAVDRGKMGPEERTALLARISYETSLKSLAPADLVIEAVPEQLELKRELFASLDTICRPDAVLATNTSSLSVTEISVATGHPRRVVGLHFFNPAPVLKFVEVVRTVVTDPAVVDDVVALVTALDKQPVVVGDKAGFIANTLLFGYLNHAVTMYEQRYATREDLDTAMVLGCGLPMGPLSLMDLIGLDTAYEILETMYREGKERLHAPAPLLKQMVSAGMKGRKSGRGFYTYAAPGSSTVVPDVHTPDEDAPTVAGRPVRTVGVVGSGTMAAGIVQVFAAAGYDVVHLARSEARIGELRGTVSTGLDKAVARGRMTAAAAESALARITGSTVMEDLSTADLVVEAVVEDLEVKKALFADLDRVCRDGAVLATSTSSLPVIDCAVSTSRPGDVVGMHFFNPAPAMKLVEVVSTVSTDPEATATVTGVCAAIGKTSVQCGDRAGFIVNALLFPYLNDAIRMLAANYAGVVDIDIAMTHGCGYPMGPFELLDVVGLDVALAIENSLYQEFRCPGFAPEPLLEHLVTAGYLGRKAGRGFRTYES
jgi:3-hydroxybutyryl-CoA dehydrogenase